MLPHTSLERFNGDIDDSRVRGPAYAPVFQGPPTSTWDLEPEGQSVPLSHYLWLMRRHRWKILPFIVICAVSTLIVSERLTPIYESTVTVDVDRRVPTGIMGQEANQSPVNDSDQFLATQVKLIQADAVLRPVADQYHLRELENENPKADPALAGDAPVILKKLKVVRPPNTFLLLISYRSADRQLAANVANAIAKSYIEHSYNIRFRSTASLSSFMEKQLEELKAKMERSNQALAQFEKELNVINPEEKTNILSSRLQQLNTDYTSAQTDRVRKEAAFRSVSSGTLESAQASSQGEALKSLAERLDEAQDKFAEIRAHFGPKHPEYSKAEARVRQITQQFEAAKRSVIGRVDAEYREASAREVMLKSAVSQTKAEFDSLNAHSFDYDALKHEAEADKKTYEELVTKIREAGINAGFQSSTVRLADNARPALKPVFPNIPLNVGLALLLSILVAAGAAVLSDTLDNTVRDTEQISRVMKTEVIGGLPKVKAWKNLLPGTASLTATTTALTGRSESDRMAASFGEAVQTLRNSILLRSFDRRIRSLLVTSATPGEGKSTIALHLALAHAQQNQRTLLIDCDLRRPSIDRKLGLTPTTGLSTVLLHGLDWRDAVLSIPDTPNLYVLLAGPASRRSTCLIGNALGQILEEAASEYDLVLLDAPPSLGFPEPLQMATVVDGVALVAVAGQTDRKALASVVGTLQKLRANVLGVVLNQVTKDLEDSYYYHGYYGKYYRYYRATSD